MKGASHRLRVSAEGATLGRQSTAQSVEHQRLLSTEESGGRARAGPRLRLTSE